MKVYGLVKEFWDANRNVYDHDILGVFSSEEKVKSQVALLLENNGIEYDENEWSDDWGENEYIVRNKYDEYETYMIKVFDLDK